MTALIVAAQTHTRSVTSWDRARTLARAAGDRLASRRIQGHERILLGDATGRTTSVNLVAQSDLPRFDASAMDGWVIRGAGPWRVGKAILAGDPPSREPLLLGSARPIATGGAVPAGASAVARSERGEIRLRGGHPMLYLTEAEPREGSDIRRAGEEAYRGDVVLRAGAVLSPPRIALAAVAGYDEVDVVPLRSVDVIILGDEVRSGAVRDAFSHALPAAVAAGGGRIGRVGLCADDPGTTRDALASSTGDIVVTTGGTSHGPTDFARSSLVALGARFLFDGVAVRPGHPVIMAELPNGQVVICLPGNPLAALLGFASFVSPVLDGARGRAPVSPPQVLLATTVPNTSQSTRLVPCTLGDRGALPTLWQGPGMLRGIANADVVAIMPPGGARRDSLVPSLPLPW